VSSPNRQRFSIVAASLLAAAAWLLPSLGRGAAAPGFDGERAFAELERQCQFGPRCPGCPGHEKALDYLVGVLGRYADEVSTQKFSHTHSADGQVLKLTNVIAVFRAQAAPARETVLLAAHWDTRPTADKEKEPARRKEPIMGANDGASGVAVLVELGRVLADRRLDRNVMLMLFDGEDYGPGASDMFLGSRHFAGHMPDPRPDWGVVVDMVGDRDLSLPIEAYSWRRARPVVERIWSAAERVGASAFTCRVGQRVLDDHLPLLDAGVPCIDIIDTGYPPWHTLGDTPDKCSAASLEQVGRVLLAVLIGD
jgi:glutaminyl-peptide cyclotransferase